MNLRKARASFTRQLVRAPVHWRVMALLLIVLVGVFVTIVTISSTGSQSTPMDFDWRADWSAETGFNVDIDAQGFEFPTAIAFVPNPGDAAGDPLYFVTELRGRVKVVTNDRSVFTFAEDFFKIRPNKVVPVIDETIGMAGICLAPDQGQVFVTFSYHDANDQLRNNIVRFQSTPDTFSTSWTSSIEFTNIFSSYPSAASHQIGPCQVNDESLFVNVADGRQIDQSQLLDSVLGKVLRMDLDGNPLAENPFYEDATIENARNYVWASGFRNPFGLAVVGDRVFVADNGPSVDRFLQITKGTNYLWDGTNTSIATNANFVFYPGNGVAHIDYYPPDSDLFPIRFKGNFFLTSTGTPVKLLEEAPAIWALPFDLDRGKLSAVPRAVLMYQGQQNQVLSALAFGPDGLYFAPLFPNTLGTTNVYKLIYDPLAEYPNVIEKRFDPTVLMNIYGCSVCHSINGNEGGTVAPNLNRTDLMTRLNERLNSEAYIKAQRQVDELMIEPFDSFREARAEVAQARGEEKIRTWLYYRILEPKFDDPDAGMPQLGLSSREAKAIADFLAGSQTDIGESSKGLNPITRVRDSVNWVSDLVQDKLPAANKANAKKYLAVFFAVGILFGVAATMSLSWIISLRRRKQN